LSLGHNKHVLELCRYLIAHAGRATPRDELRDLLWPEVEPEQALHRLHVTISRLRHLVDPRRSSTNAQTAKRASSVNSGVTSATYSAVGLVPADPAHIATTSSRSPTCSPTLTPLRLHQGGPDPNQTAVTTT